MKIKALTLTEPWASLVATGHKKFETRGWQTHYRGVVAIHAAKGITGAEVDFAATNEHSLIGTGRAKIPVYGEKTGKVSKAFTETRGKVLGVGLLRLCGYADAIQIGHKVTLADESVYEVTPTEWALGGWGAGRYWWLITHVHRLEAFVPARGALGLWDWQASNDALEWIESLRIAGWPIDDKGRLV